MNRRSILSTSAITALALVMLSGSVPAQQKTLKEQLIGTWTLVSWEQATTDGTKRQDFGRNYGLDSTKAMASIPPVSSEIDETGAPEDEIEITRRMRAAGVRVFLEYEDSGISADYVVEQVYSAMLAAKGPQAD
jgi:hypothetical protein